VKKTIELPILPDARYPTMFRVQLPDGTVTDMVNLTRANDAAAIIARDLMRDSMRAARARGGNQPPQARWTERPIAEGGGTVRKLAAQE
jgi:hypothetical protein